MPELPFHSLLFTLGFDQAAQLPAWKGSTIRGVLGHGLQAQAAAYPAPDWPGCMTASLASVLFEPQIAWGDSQATQVWSLHCIDTKIQFQAGDTLGLGFSLFGTWPSWARTAFCDSLAAGLAQGLGRGRVPARIIAHHEETVPPARIPPGATALRLQTRSPCHLQDHRTHCRALNAPAIARSLLRRWRQLQRQLTGEDGIAPVIFPGHAGQRFSEIVHRPS